MVLRTEDVEPWQVGGEDERDAVGEDEYERDLPYDADHCVEYVDGEQSKYE